MGWQVGARLSDNKIPHKISEKNLSHLTVLLLLLLKLGVTMGETPKLVKENQAETLQGIDDLEGVGNLDEMEGE